MSDVFIICFFSSLFALGCEHLLMSLDIKFMLYVFDCES